MKILGFNITFGRTPNKEVERLIEEVKQIKGVMANQTPDSSNRSSTPPRGVSLLSGLEKELNYVKPTFNLESISVIRKLAMVNPDVGLALHDIVELTNTGHKIRFGESVPADMADEMRKYLKDSSKNWGDGVCGIEGLINKLISQIWISGALSAEVVPNLRLNGVDNVILVDPEDIRWIYDKRVSRYKPYQQTSIGASLNTETPALIKLNQNQYKYFAINGDQEIPYGIPPMITALKALNRQTDMDDNIGFIIKQIGVMGFLEFLMEKPDRNSNESETEYLSRLSKTLVELKQNIKGGFKEGVVVGYKDDHQANFHSTTTNINGLDSLYNLNEIQVSNGLKTPPSFIGANTGNTQGSISIIFTKMLSQLGNIQMQLSAFLEFLYKMQLVLGGYKPKYTNTLCVEFKASTITDDLKIQQAGEIKRRNLKADYDQGLISQETFAEELGYEKPDQPEPRPIPLDPNNAIDPVAKKERKDDKNDSARRSRDKVNPQPKRRDQDSKNP